MAFASTQLDITTAAVQVIGSATTWGNSLHAGQYQPVTLYIVNPSAVPVHLVGSSGSTAQGYTVSSNATPMQRVILTITSPGDALFARTTASTATLGVLVDRQ